jgi:hypothetical protein
MKGLSMDKNEEMICDGCGQIFQSSIEVQSPIKHCPKCVQKNREKMNRIRFGVDSNANDDEVNISYSTVCEPYMGLGLYALLDTVLNKVVVLIQEAAGDVFYRRNGDWMDLSDEDDGPFDFDGLMVIDVKGTFITIYDEAESSSKDIGTDRVKEYMAKIID